MVYGDEHLLRYTKDSYRDLQGLVMPSYLPLPVFLSPSCLSLLLLYSCLNSLFYKAKSESISVVNLVYKQTK